MIILSTQILSEERDDVEVLNLRTAKVGRGSWIIEPGHLVEIEMDAVGEVCVVRIVRQSAEEIRVSVAELLHVGVLIATAQDQKGPVKCRDRNHGPSAIETESGFNSGDLGTRDRKSTRLNSSHRC